MGLLSRGAPEARTTLNWKRLKCDTYEECYTYFKQNVKEWEKVLGVAGNTIADIPIWALTEKGTGDAKELVVETTGNGEVFLQISVKQMPVYWSVEKEMEDDDVTQKTVDIKKWDTDTGELKTLRNEKLFMGLPRFKVSSLDEGWQIIKDLAESEDSDFKEILTNVADAIPKFEQAKKDTEAYAKILYAKAQAADNASDAFKAMGAWGDGDEDGVAAGSRKTSKAKTIKKGQYKEAAKRALGHARVKESKEGFK